MSDPGLGTWLVLVGRRWRFLVITGALAGLLTLALSFLMPKWYTSQAAILPPREATAVLAAQGMARILGLPTDLPFSGGVTTLDTYLGILESETVSRALIETYGLQRIYKQSTLVRTVKKLRSHTEIDLNMSGVISIRVEEKDPQLAADLANAYVRELNAVVTATQTSAGKRQRIFLEERVRNSRAKLDSLELALAEMQRETGITSLNRNASEAALVSGALMGRRMAVAVQIQMMDLLSVDSAPLRDQLELELRALDGEIAKLPELGTGLVRVLRDVRMQEALHGALRHNLETARLEEIRETPVVEILDHAMAADRHSRPRKGLMTVAGAMLGAGLGLVFCAYQEGKAEAA